MIDRHEKIMKLFDDYASSLHGSIARIVRDDDVCGDLMQELFIKLIKSDGFMKADRAYGYALRVAVNLAFDHLRKNKRQCLELMDQQTPSNVRSASESLEIRSDIDRVLEATSKLDTSARDIIVMRYIEEKSYEQISLEMGKKQNHLRSMCSKAIVKLRDILGNSDLTQNNREGL